MDAKLFKIAGGIAGLAGIAVAAYFLLFKGVLGLGIFPGLSQAQAYALLHAILILTFGVVAMVLATRRKTSGSLLDYTPTLMFLTAMLAAIYVAVLPTAQPSPPPAPPPQPLGKSSFKLCFGEGGGSNCLSGADIKYGCNTYWSWSAKAWDDLAVNLCRSKDKMTKVQTQNNGGGGCGWTAFTLTCTP